MKLWHIGKTSEENRNICAFNKLCVFFNPYIWSHTFKVGICFNIYIWRSKLNLKFSFKTQPFKPKKWKSNEKLWNLHGEYFGDYFGDYFGLHGESLIYIYFLPSEVIDGLKTLHKKKNNRERNVQRGRRLFLPDLFWIKLRWQFSK